MDNIDVQIDKWKNKLLDLGKRNRLINYKETKRSSIKIVEPKLEEVFNKLVVEGKSLSFSHYINETFDIYANKVHEKINEGDIKTDRTINEQQKTLESLRNKSRIAIQEQGINILYLYFGFLNWKEINTSEIYIKSPLVLVPVSLTIESVTDPFVLNLHEDEIVVNPTLLYKLENDFGIVLPDFDLQENILDYLGKVGNIARKNNWKVIHEMGLSLLSFLKINMYKDLENNTDKIKNHSILRGLAGDTNSIDEISDEYDCYDHDAKIKSIDMFQVVDADSSQQDAILYSKKNLSFVLQGPPGTGKSQTITNIISEALADGKKVLFVSEKMAALEVVYKKLSQVGISDFCLTLHNHKVKKKEVLNDLGNSINMNKVKIREEELYLLESLENHKEKLNMYVKELHMKNRPLNKTIYEVNGLLAKLPKTKDIIFSIEDIDKINLEQLNRYKFLLEEFAQTIGKLKSEYETNPWFGCNVLNVSHELRHDIETNLRKIIPYINELKDMKNAICMDFQWEIKSSINSIEEMIEVLKYIENAPNIPTEWIYINNINLLLETTNTYVSLSTEYNSIYKYISNNYTNEYFLISPYIYEEMEQLEQDVSQKINRNIYDEIDLIIDNFDSIIDNLNIIIQKLTSAKNYTYQIIEKYDFNKVKNIEQLYDINDIFKGILKNPKPTEMWFDSSKETVILDLLERTRGVYSEISEVKKDLMDAFDKDILSLNYDPILTRFRTEYGGILKIFKKMYRTDRKVITSLSINHKNNISDAKIINVLNKLKKIEDKKSWLIDNEHIIKCAFGTHYLNEYTDWNEVKNSLNIFKNIKSKLGNKINSSNIKSLLLSKNEDIEDIIIANNKINELETDEITEKITKVLNCEDDIEEIINLSNDLLKDVKKFKSLYEDLKRCSNEKYSYSKYIKDLKKLQKIKEIDDLIEAHNNELKEKFLFLYNGINTEWENVKDSLMWANKFIKLQEKYNFSDMFIKNVCNGEKYSEVIFKVRTALEGKVSSFKTEWDWFNNLFDKDINLSDLELDNLINRLENCLNGIAELEEWIDFRSCREKCYKEGLGEYIEKAEKANIFKTQLVEAFLKRFYRLWLDAIITKYPAISSFRRRTQENVIEEFKKLDIIQLAIARSRIKQRLIDKLPNLNIPTSARDEVGILKRELGKQKKLMPLRRLFKAIPNLLMNLKPCIMMSPLSVSLFLQADEYDFDMVIFDEASQVRTEDAVGAIMRGKQIIITGDNQQLPPTSFFGATVSDGDFDMDDDKSFNDTDGFESILDEALTFLPERTLKWHYRSKHEHLIAFSNAKIYNNSLITFPSSFNKVKDNGVEYIYVSDGIYERGGKKDNINEAKKVAQLVFEHMQKFPNRSLGIVTFSSSQQQAIENVIRQFRLKNQQYEEFFNEDKEDAFFIKNLENVQGDERDTIIFSIGYAKDHNGIMYMNFGPLSKNGGYRRLNVAITRAKYNIKLVGSIYPTDINIDKTNSEGVKMLRSYIEFAINGESVLQNELTYNNNIEIESPFEEAVYIFLSENGYNVATQVGCSGYRIDLAVRHPKLSGRFVLGIECDGATYHSARTARERDRIRQTVLEDIGWKIYRIWSTDWIKDPKTEGDRLLKYIEKCISEYVEDDLNSYSQINKNNIVNSISEKFVDTQDTIDEDIQENRNCYNFKYYVKSNVYDVERNIDEIQYLADLVKHVVKIEYPIHFELLCKRLACIFGRQKVTSVVRNSIKNINDIIKDEIIINENFYWWKEDTKVKVRIPENGGKPRPISYICVEEVAECMLIIVRMSFGITKSSLLLEAERMLGFNRSGKNITIAMETAYEYLSSHNRIKIVNDKVTLF